MRPFVGGRNWHIESQESTCFILILCLGENICCHYHFDGTVRVLVKGKKEEKKERKEKVKKILLQCKHPFTRNIDRTMSYLNYIFTNIEIQTEHLFSGA